MPQTNVLDENSNVQQGGEELRLEDGSRDASEKGSIGTEQYGFFSSRRILGPMERERGDLALLVCCFVTGLVDAASFMNWGIFVAMQTGNTVILGLSTAGLPANPHGWLTTLTSLISFLLGALLTFRISTALSPQGPTTNRLLTTTIFLTQGLFILLAAVLATIPDLIPQNPPALPQHAREPESVIQNIRIVSLVPPLALQSGMQIATSRLMGFNELPINVLTSTYCDIMGDFRLLALNNVKRNRRCLAVVLLLAGAICSGWLMRGEGGLASVLWLAGGLKIVAGLGVFCFMPVARQV